MHDVHANASAWLWWIPKSWPHVPLASVHDSLNKDIIRVRWNWQRPQGSTPEEPHANLVAGVLSPKKVIDDLTSYGAG